MKKIYIFIPNIFLTTLKKNNCQGCALFKKNQIDIFKKGAVNEGYSGHNHKKAF